MIVKPNLLKVYEILPLNVQKTNSKLLSKLNYVFNDVLYLKVILKLGFNQKSSWITKQLKISLMYWKCCI